MGSLLFYQVLSMNNGIGFSLLLAINKLDFPTPESMMSLKGELQESDEEMRFKTLAFPQDNASVLICTRGWRQMN